MGGQSSSAQTQQSQTSPWDAAQPMLKSILGQVQGNMGNTGLTGAESGALGSIEANANNPYASQIGGYASSLLNGGGANAQAGNVQGNLSTYQNQMTPYANGSMVGHNPALQAQLDQMRSDISNQVNGQFAGAGRDFSGANQMALGRGISAGLAPVIAGQYNQDVQNQMGASNALYGAGNATAGQLSGMQQNYLGNQGAGVQASHDALSANNYGANQILNAEAARRGIPTQALGLLAQIGIPIAGLGGQSSGSSNTTNQMSGAQQFATIAGGIGSMIPKGPMTFNF